MSVPKSIVETALKQGLAHMPDLLAGVGELFAAMGHPLDLGPMTPDARKHFGDVDRRVDAARAAQRNDADELPRPFHPPAKPSER